MHLKKQKLQRQYSADSKQKSNIFAGVMIYVNGLTEPPADELRELVVEHGGAYTVFNSKTLVTHVIAANLCDAKLKDTKTQKVLSPQWILDSIERGKQLPIGPYLVYLRDGAAQQQLTFNKAIARPAFTSKVSAGKQAPPPQALTAPKETSEQTIPASTVAPTRPLIRSEVDEEAWDAADLEEEEEGADAVDPAQKSGPRKRKHGRIQYEGGARTAGEDPGFLEHYLGKSRLHYLSTWGAECREFTRKIREEYASRNTLPSASIDAQQQRTFVHLDLDAFFVNVSLRSRPDLARQPVAISHVASDDSSGSIASCNYVARGHGLKNGMSMRRAKAMCPNLVALPYEFEKYRAASRHFYALLGEVTSEIQSVSCDEVFLDLTSILAASDRVSSKPPPGVSLASIPSQATQATSESDSSPGVDSGKTSSSSASAIISALRARIASELEITASAGIATNMLLARMATRKAKPNGQLGISPSQAEDFMAQEKVGDLPGVGWSLAAKLKEMNVLTCADLRQISKGTLQESFGLKTGLQLFNYARGIDDRTLKLNDVRKSVSVEVSWGVRFDSDDEVERFMQNVVDEVWKRLQMIGRRTKAVSLRLMVRSTNAAPALFLGHGICDNVSRAHVFSNYAESAAVIFDCCKSMYRPLNIEPKDLRGLGVSLHKLDDESSNVRTPRAAGAGSLRRFLKPTSSAAFPPTSSSAIPSSLDMLLPAQPKVSPNRTLQVVASSLIPAVADENEKELSTPNQDEDNDDVDDHDDVCDGYAVDQNLVDIKPITPTNPELARPPTLRQTKSADSDEVIWLSDNMQSVALAEQAQVTFAAVETTAARDRIEAESSETISFEGKVWTPSPGAAVDLPFLRSLPAILRDEVLRDLVRSTTLIPLEDLAGVTAAGGRTALTRSRQQEIERGSTRRETTSPVTAGLVGDGPKAAGGASRSRNRGRGRGRGGAKLEVGLPKSAPSRSSKSIPPQVLPQGPPAPLIASKESEESPLQESKMCSNCEACIAAVFCHSCDQTLCPACDAPLHAHRSKRSHKRTLLDTHPGERLHKDDDDLFVVPVSAGAATSNLRVPQPSVIREPRGASAMTTATRVPSPLPPLAALAPAADRSSRSTNAVSFCSLCDSHVADRFCARCKVNCCRVCFSFVHLHEGSPEPEPVQVVSAVGVASEPKDSVTAGSKHPASTLPMLHGKNDKAGVRAMMAAWIDYHPEPIESDVTAFEAYMDELAKIKRIDIIWANLRFLRQLVASQDLWRETFNGLLARSQAAVSELYGGSLPVRQL
eukprot:m.907153 g.907153  ORF g.907153 m.907153 type:complete len:1278 (-) comp60087_c1_seq5:170-4003(-)